MTRSRIGPLALEAPMGGPQSRVFRALHVQQRIQVVVRVFPITMGLTPELKREFSDHVERLKSIRHPNIVRCFGGGFDAKDAYLVFELFDGDSLDNAIARRERLPWESVLEIGIQICNALQLAHESGLYHGRIRPDKILLSEDISTAKLSDLRMEMPPYVPIPPAQLAYAPPESFSDQPKVNASWDIYSLGATLYHALTGTPPFTGENASNVRHAVLNTPLPSVASLVFDCPVWLSTIVEQMLHRDPVKRPYSAAAAALALREAQRRASEGIGVVEHAVSGFSPLQLKTDRAEAERVLGIKKKKQRRRFASEEDEGSYQAFWEKPIVLLSALALLIALIAFLVWPLNESQMKTRAESLLATEDAVRWNDARDKYLLPMLEKYPAGTYADWAQEQLDMVEMRNAEERMRRNLRVGREPSSEGERKYSEAVRFERFGDRVTALDKYKGIVKLLKDEEKDRPFVNLAKRQVAVLESNPPSIEELRRFLQEKLAEADRLYEASDLLGSRQIWEGIVSLYNGNQEMIGFVEKAQRRLSGDKTRSPGEEKTSTSPSEDQPATGEVAPANENLSGESSPSQSPTGGNR